MSIDQCNICPWHCNVNRKTHLGACGAPSELKINTYFLHFGEEPVLVGSAGSGTIFFSHCNLRCCFCQNFQISAGGEGKIISEHELERICYELQEKGALNINLVSPTIYSLSLIPTLQRVKKNGLNIPIVWNSNAYEKIETLKQLEGLVDIYLPDFKYGDDFLGNKYSQVPNYTVRAQQAIREMYRQTGNLILDDDEIAIFGTMIRLLVLPNQQSKTEKILHWVAEEIGTDVAISLMSQYYPAFQAKNSSLLGRGVSEEEYGQMVEIMTKLGFENGFIQEPSCTPEWTPEFSRS